MKKLICVFLFCLCNLTLSHSALADEPFFFEMPNGEEMKGVAGRDSSGAITVTIFVSSFDSQSQVFGRYVSEALHGNLYYYDFVNCPTSSCHVGYSGNKKYLQAWDSAKKVVEDMASAAGTRSVTEVMDHLLNDSDVETSKFQFAVIAPAPSHNPVFMCAMVAGGGCDPIEHAVFVSNDNGFVVSFPDPIQFSGDEAAYFDRVEAAIRRWIRHNERVNYSCTTSVHVGSDGKAEIRLTCRKTSY